MAVRHQQLIPLAVSVGDLVPEIQSLPVALNTGVSHTVQLNPDHCTHQGHFYCCSLVFVAGWYF